MKSKSHLETLFASILATMTAAPRPETQFHFHPTRRWRLDFAWPRHRVAVEIDGGQFSRPKSGRIMFDTDTEKHNALTILGWRLLRYTTLDLQKRPVEMRPRNGGASGHDHAHRRARTKKYFSGRVLTGNLRAIDAAAELAATVGHLPNVFHVAIPRGMLAFAPTAMIDRRRGSWRAYWAGHVFAFIVGWSMAKLTVYMLERLL